MKPLWMALIAASVAAHAESGMPAKPGTESKPDSSVKSPRTSGMVVEPPETGSGSRIVKTPPVTGDSEIDDATKGIDRKNRERLQDKQKKPSR